jgi:D-tyrosyl-tRNA(Tyr) deacylase
MRALIQRVSRASVDVDGETVSSIDRGFLVLLGITQSDSAKEAASLAKKVAGMRLFEDADEKMNLGLSDVGGEVLCVSQFTLYGNVRKGRRPSFSESASAETARPLYEAFCVAIEAEDVTCKQGRFQEHMDVSLVNDGPVTLLIDTADLEKPRRG